MNEMSKELRIGNVVSYNGTHNIVEGIQKAYIWTSYQHGLIMIDDVKPIPLTPEKLEKCGFVKQSDGQLWLTISNRIHIIWDGEINVWMGDYYILDEVSPIPVPCPHLHTLQNLFHSLTGKELAV